MLVPLLYEAESIPNEKLNSVNRLMTVPVGNLTSNTSSLVTVSASTKVNTIPTSLLTWKEVVELMLKVIDLGVNPLMIPVPSSIG